MHLLFFRLQWALWAFFRLQWAFSGAAWKCYSWPCFEFRELVISINLGTDPQHLWALLDWPQGEVCWENGVLEPRVWCLGPWLWPLPWRCMHLIEAMGLCDCQSLVMGLFLWFPIFLYHCNSECRGLTVSYLVFPHCYSILRVPRIQGPQPTLLGCLNSFKALTLAYVFLTAPPSFHFKQHRSP